MDRLLQIPRAVLFDMDGTLTEPLLDFAQIKRDMGIGDRPILETLKRLTGSERDRAQAVLDRHEAEAAEASTLNAGCRALLQWLEEAGVRVAVVTRNTRKSTATVMQKHGLPFDVLITRDDGAYKPEAAPLQLACERLGVSTEEAWMIGDGVHDVQAGIAAGVKTIWISHGRTKPFAEVPWRTSRNLLDVRALLIAVNAAEI